MQQEKAHAETEQKKQGKKIKDNLWSYVCKPYKELDLFFRGTSQMNHCKECGRRLMLGSYENLGLHRTCYERIKESHEPRPEQVDDYYEKGL